MLFDLWCNYFGLFEVTTHKMKSLHLPADYQPQALHTHLIFGPLLLKSQGSPHTPASQLLPPPWLLHGTSSSQPSPTTCVHVH